MRPEETLEECIADCGDILNNDERKDDSVAKEGRGGVLAASELVVAATELV